MSTVTVPLSSVLEAFEKVALDRRDAAGGSTAEALRQYAREKGLSSGELFGELAKVLAEFETWQQQIERTGGEAALVDELDQAERRLAMWRRGRWLREQLNADLAKAAGDGDLLPPGAAAAEERADAATLRALGRW